MELLNETEVRILGTLIEKQLATPEYYPMTLNAVRLGANQKQGRNPVTSLSEAEVQEALDTLQIKRLAALVKEYGARAPKYRQFLDREFKLEPPALAVLAVLMLRGPQTVGELRARSESMHKFASTQEVEEVLRLLMNLTPNPLVTRLERQSGEREPRYAHLLSGTPTPVVRVEERSELEARVEALEAEVRELRAVLMELKQALGA
ncbi:YceH family protein [Calidithermus timidus]|uniref:YceH family protein n=1 Tax=Calidithermus timidus TaxID=307124 RepID=UPI0003726ED1|nr:YceH family protein [Calidithermus timidus]